MEVGKEVNIIKKKLVTQGLKELWKWEKLTEGTDAEKRKTCASDICVELIILVFQKRYMEEK